MPIKLRTTEAEREAILGTAGCQTGASLFYRPPVSCYNKELFCRLAARCINSGTAKQFWLDLKTIYMPADCLFEKFTDHIKVYPNSYCYNCGTMNLSASDRPITHYCPYCCEPPTMAVQQYVADVNYKLDIFKPDVVSLILTSLSSERYVSLRLPNRCPDTW